MVDGEITLNSLLSMVKDAFPNPSPNRYLMVHPQRYQELRERLYDGENIRSLPWDYSKRGIPFNAIRVVVDPYMPLTSTVRRKRFLTKKQRNRWFVRKYKKVEVPVFGWWMEDQPITFGGNNGIQGIPEW